MEIVKLPIGEPAPADADCLRIEEMREGRWRLTTAALCVADDADDSVAIVGGQEFTTSDEAEQAGLVWAETVGVNRLYVSIGTIAVPLRLTEADRPL